MSSKISSNTPNIVNTSATDPLLSDIEAAALLNLSDNTLAVWRSTKREGPPYIKLGRAVRYQLSALSQYIESCKVSSGGSKND